jgi:hypothetical protein
MTNLIKPHDVCQSNFSTYEILKSKKCHPGANVLSLKQMTTIIASLDSSHTYFVINQANLEQQ